MTNSPVRSPIWHQDRHTTASCPVCGYAGEKRIPFEIDSIIPGGPRLAYANCGSCGSIFQLDFKAPDYAASLSPITLKYYIEQGAGLDILTIVPFLASRNAGRPVHRYLEIGCGFGFGLDFARSVFNWEVRGIDPGEHAQEGRRLLGLDIDMRYLAREDAAGVKPYDAVAAMEVIEHMERPHEFMEILKACVAPGGILILSTPDAAYVEFGVDKPALLSILTPGYHVILYSHASIAHLLHKAGFEEVKVEALGATLVAVAGPKGCIPEIRDALDRNLYASYLVRRLDTVEPTSALGVGLGYRLLKEYVNRGRYAEAEPVLQRLAEAILARDGIDIRDPHGSLARVAHPTAFEDFVRRLPACLTGLFYFSAMLRLNHREDRFGAVTFFYAALVVAGIFRKAMRDYGIEDGETVDLERSARKHIRLVLGWMEN